MTNPNNSATETTTSDSVETLDGRTQEARRRSHRLETKPIDHEKRARRLSRKQTRDPRELPMTDPYHDPAYDPHMHEGREQKFWREQEEAAAAYAASAPHHDVERDVHLAWPCTNESSVSARAEIVQYIEVMDCLPLGPGDIVRLRNRNGGCAWLVIITDDGWTLFAVDEIEVSGTEPLTERDIRFADGDSLFPIQLSQRFVIRTDVSMKLSHEFLTESDLIQVVSHTDGVDLQQVLETAKLRPSVERSVRVEGLQYEASFYRSVERSWRDRKDDFASV